MLCVQSYLYQGKNYLVIPTTQPTDFSTCSMVVQSGSEVLTQESAATTFDYAQAAAIFAFFFSFIVGTWFVAKNFGLILEAVRRW